MPRLPMINTGFETIPEGTHVFRIYAVEYVEAFGRITVKMVNADGLTHVEKYGVLNVDGTLNERTLGAFSYLAKTALNDFSRADVDPMELVDHYVKAEVVHNVVQSNKGDGSTVTFVNLGRKDPAPNGFEKQPVPRAMSLGHNQPKAEPVPETPAVEASTGLDLDSLLG